MKKHMIALLLTCPGAADEPGSDPSGGSYCGIFSVYGALHAIGVKVDFDSLLNQKYLGSACGSSLEELKRAVEDHGAEATPLEGLTTGSIRFLQHPLILHVRPPGKDTEYSHWVLVLGMKNGKAVFVDPPESPYEMEVAQLLAASDGIGLHVRPKGASAVPLMFNSRLAHVPVVLGCTLGLVVVGMLVRRLKLSAIPTMFLVAAVSGVVAFADNVSTHGLFRNPAAIAYVRGRHLSPALPEVSISDVARLVGQEDVQLIDARIPIDFKHGHLPNAVNIPITSGLASRDRAVKDLAPAQQVVVYCQSSSCAWADSLAADLALRGFRDVKVLREGWEGWKENALPSKLGDKRQPPTKEP